MRVLLSTVGSRGEVQPILALAAALRTHGHHVQVCAPPDFREIAHRDALPFTPLGPPVRDAGRRALPTTAQQLRNLLADTVTGQFTTLRTAAADCDLILGCGALQLAAHSIAEYHGIDYRYAAYCSITLPSAHHSPLPMPGLPHDPDTDHRTRWRIDSEHWNTRWSAPVDDNRAALGLPPVGDVRDHIFTDRPLLASDPVLDPRPDADPGTTHTGAWLPTAPAEPLPESITAFLDAGEAPIYAGYGSVHTGADSARVLVESARALGRRLLLQRGWTGLAPIDTADDCLAIDDIDHRALFGRVAAVVHHGGAGTTTTAAAAGTPQVIAPHHYDQPHWARRVTDLGIGVGLPPGDPDINGLTAALSAALDARVATRAHETAATVRLDGAIRAAEHLTR